MPGRRPLALALLLLGAPDAALAVPAHAGCHGEAPAVREAVPHAHHQAVEHPEPRPGVSGRRVLAADRFSDRPTQSAYRLAKEIPQVLDGLHCQCECHDRDRLRSLLSCFENEMAATCAVCQEQATAAHQLHRAGKTLAEVRAALDAAHGS